MAETRVEHLAQDTAPSLTDVTYLVKDPTGTPVPRKVALSDVGRVGSRMSVNAQTGTTYTPVLGDELALVTQSNAAAITVTLPQDSALAFPIGGQITFVQLGAGQVTFTAGTGATVNSTPTAKTRAQYSVVTAIKRAANTWLIVGDVSAV